MINKSASGFVASQMDAILNSPEHKAIYGTQYKFAQAQDEQEAKDKCPKCSMTKDQCKCGDTMAVEDGEVDVSNVEDNAEAADMESAAAYDVAIDSLLTASAALDSVGLEKSAVISLKLASLIVEAKKKEVSSKSKPGSKSSSTSSSKAKCPKCKKEKGVGKGKCTCKKSSSTSGSKTTSKK